MDPNISTCGHVGSWKLKSHLVVFGLVLAAPILIGCGYLLFRNIAVEQVRLDERISEKAGDSADSIDRELVGIITALQVLATSPSLESGDYAAFYRQARTALHTHSNVTAIVTERGIAKAQIGHPFRTR